MALRHTFIAHLNSETASNSRVPRYLAYQLLKKGTAVALVGNSVDYINKKNEKGQALASPKQDRKAHTPVQSEEQLAKA